MNHKKMVLSAMAAMWLVPAAFSQVEKLSNQEKQAFEAQLPGLLKNEQTAPAVKQHLSRVKTVNAIRGALAAQGRTVTGPFLYFAVDPTSDAQYLPDAYPYDAEAQEPVRIVAAKDEYEPGSFVIYALDNLGKVQLKLTEFKNAKGDVFPASDLDLKFIKVWYQNGNGWYSYFGDGTGKLVPELLINDEELIHAEAKDKTNYARSYQKDGSVKYEWVGAPYRMDTRLANHYNNPPVYLSMSPKFRDAKTLQPVNMPEGEYKQFFLTAHIPAFCKEGLYKGEVELVAKDGKKLGGIPVTIKVLPFTLPDPKSYDLSKDFIVFQYAYLDLLWFAAYNGGDFDLAEKQYISYHRNMVKHNEKYMHVPVLQEFYADLSRKAGMSSKYVLGSICYNNWIHHYYEIQQNAKDTKAFYDRVLPDRKEVFCGFGDEEGAQWFVTQRMRMETFHKAGFKSFIAGNQQTFWTAGYYWDFFNMSNSPEDGRDTADWNQVGRAWTAWYAQQHVGVENPANTRRQYGMAPWLSGYSALSNYAHHLGALNDMTPDSYKPMVFAYGAYDSELCTLSWEGMREGIDDIRYGTLMKELAKQAQASPDVRTQYAGGKALQFLAEFKKESTDLRYARMEMIRHILELRKLLNVK